MEKDKIATRKVFAHIGKLFMALMNITGFILAIISFFKNDLKFLGNLFITMLVINVVALIIFAIYSTCLWFESHKLKKEIKEELNKNIDEHKKENDKLVESINKKQLDIDFLHNTIKFLRNTNNECILQTSKSVSVMEKCLNQIHKILISQEDIEIKNENIIIELQNVRTELKRRYDKFFSKCTDELKGILDNSFKNKELNIENSIAFKQLDSVLSLTSTNYSKSTKNAISNAKIITTYRNTDTYKKHEREVGTAEYTISGNCDFNHCLNKECFCKNNITEKDVKTYQNENKDFDRYYNCTLVVPIFTTTEDGKNLYGYLAADTLNLDVTKDEIYGDEETKIMISVASSIAIYFSFMERYWGDILNTINSLLKQNSQKISDSDTNSNIILEIEFLKMIYDLKHKSNNLI